MPRKAWGGRIQQELVVVEHACWSRPAADFVEVLLFVEVSDCSLALRERGISDTGSAGLKSCVVVLLHAGGC